MNRSMTEKIKALMLNGGMDLVGFGPVSRWKNAPFLLSPGAILPESRTVIVGAMHITDTWTEMGGEPEPQDRSPGGWMDQNVLLDHVAYCVVRFLTDRGQKAVGVASSNIWRYREYEGIPSLFAPDLSHIHAAVAAGLGEIGWSGLAITPEFGSRCRFISIVTDAELVPSPMYDGPRLCDMCGECIRACPTAAMRKDLNSVEPHRVEIGGKVYKYANKNIWRCAWAEHFELNLNSRTLENEHIDEGSIVTELNDGGRRGHARGVCQKVCVPPHLRSKNPSFGRPEKQITQNRINRRYPDNVPTLRKMRDDIIAEAVRLGSDLVMVSPLDTDSTAGRHALLEAPGMCTVIAIAMRTPPEAVESGEWWLQEDRLPYHYALRVKMHQNLLRLARTVEDYGYHAASYTGMVGPVNPAPGKSVKDFLNANPQYFGFAEMAGLGVVNEQGRFVTPEFGESVMVGAVVADAPLDHTPRKGDDYEACVPVRVESNDLLRRELETTARDNLVSLFGVAPVDRFDAIIEDLKANVKEELLTQEVRDNSPWHTSYHGPFNPEIVAVPRHLRHPQELVQNARSVIVLGVHLPREIVANSGLLESQQIGCYAFYQYQTTFELRFAAVELATRLAELGHATRITENLLGVGGQVCSHRGMLPDARCNAIEAVAAGLGQIGKSGNLMTEKYGPHQRLIAIVTDAELPFDEVITNYVPCRDCDLCLEKCPMKALSRDTFELRVDGCTVAVPRIDRHRCDWSKRYGLCKEEGPALIGNKTDVLAPEGEITVDKIAEACKSRDPIMKGRPCVLETCMRDCPAGHA